MKPYPWVSKGLSFRAVARVWGRVTIALLLCLAVGGQPLAVGATPFMPEIVLVINDLVASPKSATLCIGEKKLFWVYAYRRVNRVFAPPWTAGKVTHTYEANEPIWALVDDPNVGEIFPYEATTGGAPPARAAFVFYAKEEGTATITFTQTESFIVPAGAPPLGDPFDTTTVDVEVKHCKFRLVAFSHWILRDGFWPRMTSVLSADVEPSGPGNKFSIDVPVENQVNPLVHLGTSGLCTPTIETTGGKTEAHIEGELDANGDLNFDITYELVTASTKVVCPGDISGEAEDTGQPLVLDPQPLRFSGPAGGFSGVLPHILHAYQDVNGHTTLIVVAIPQ